MKLDRYYFITSLPALGELGSEPPIDFVELREYLGDDPGRRELVGCLFLLDDLLQREAYLAGELKEVAPAVLSERQVRNQSPLPEFLLATDGLEGDDSRGPRSSVSGQSSPAGKGRGSSAVDETWEAYFRHVARMAVRIGCGFLAAWVRQEVTLRNALVSVRARRLGLDEGDYLVAADLAEEDEEMQGLMSDWEGAPTPLAGHQVVIRARWEWLAEHDGHFTFRDDELAAYALRLMLLRQWRRVSAR
jgi:hypothetical protein